MGSSFARTPMMQTVSCEVLSYSEGAGWDEKVRENVEQLRNSCAQLYFLQLSQTSHNFLKLSTIFSYLLELSQTFYNVEKYVF